MCTCTCTCKFDQIYIPHVRPPCPQVLVPVVTWEVALASSSRTTAAAVVVVEGAGEVGVATEEGVEETKQLDSQMGACYVIVHCHSFVLN